MNNKKNVKEIISYISIAWYCKDKKIRIVTLKTLKYRIDRQSEIETQK